MLILNLQYFGGRGASFGGNNRPKGGGSNGNGNFNPYSVGQKIPEQGKLRESLGKQGKPFSMENALKNANPYYNGGYAEYSENCQRAVVAYEMRRRGYDVMALPTYKDDKLPVRAWGNNGYWQRAFKKAKMVTVGKTTPKATQAAVENEIRKWGKNTRGIIRIPGHVFNVENVNGRIRYIDAQTNTKYTSNGVFNRLSKRELPEVAVMRTDNLRISDRARESVIKRKGKR